MADVMNLREVASYLRVHPNTIYRLARSGRLPAFKVGTDWRFHRAAVDAYLQAQRNDTSGTPPGDVLDLVYWLLGQGLSLTVSQAEIARVLDWRPAAVRDAIRALLSAGYLTLARDQVALTPEGMTEARRRSAGPRRPPSGHESVASFQERYRSA